MFQYCLLCARNNWGSLFSSSYGLDLVPLISSRSKIPVMEKWFPTLTMISGILKPKWKKLLACIFQSVYTIYQAVNFTPEVVSWDQSDRGAQKTLILKSSEKIRLRKIKIHVYTARVCNYKKEEMGIWLFVTLNLTLDAIPLRNTVYQYRNQSIWNSKQYSTTPDLWQQNISETILQLESEKLSKYSMNISLRSKHALGNLCQT